VNEPQPHLNAADGEWHRLHPATPLLRGGIALIAIISFMIVQLRDELINNFFGAENGDDPIGAIRDSEYLWLVIIAIIVGLALFVFGFYLSWRMHSFRITDEVVEVRSGVLFRTNRKGRLDRIQGINVVKSFIPRVFGASKLEVNVAGQDANVQLAYLPTAVADQLRADILRLASGTHEASIAQTAAGSGDIIRDRVAELLGPELDPEKLRAESVVSMNLGRVVGSIVLGDGTVFVIAAIVGISVTAGATGSPLFLVGIIPGLIGIGSYYVRRFGRSLRFTIAGTPDGVRIGYGLLSTTNETLPPGRIHSVQVSQPLLWRIPGWWEVKVNRAAKSSASGAANQENTTILPVGNRDDVLRVLALVLPTLDHDGRIRHGLHEAAGDGYTNSPRRAAVIRWFSWRRNGIALTDDAVLLRKGFIWRELVIVPLARLQSVALQVGWLRRRLRLATLRLHTVAGPITPVIGGVDQSVAHDFFARIAEAASERGRTDTSQRWRSND
jgi:putative membrane protein